jgi:hypothetical protein
MRRASRLSALVIVALCVSGATALAAPAPRLTVGAVKQIALRAAQFQPIATAAYQPDSRLKVVRAQLSHVGKQAQWLVHVRATIVIFPCRLPAPGGPVPYGCLRATSKDALVTIAAATGRVLSLKAVDAAGYILTAGATAAASPCPGVLYAPPPAGAPAPPAVTCSPGLVGIGNVGITPAQRAALEAVPGAPHSYGGGLPCFVCSQQD